MSYDEKFRRHVLKTREEEGLSLAKVAKRFAVSANCIGRALKRLGITYKKTLKHPKAYPESRGDG